MAVRGFLGSHQLEAALDILSSLWSQPIPKTVFGGHRIGFVWTMNPWQAWQNYIYIYIWVGNCVGNLCFSPFFFVDPFFSARFPCYVQHFGAESCHFNCLCNILELEPLIFHRICNILVEFVAFDFGAERCCFNGICNIFEFELFM